jgi:uncharacterized membrane protein YebE (DUF533 family)
MDIFSNLTNLLGQAAGAAGAAPSRQAGAADGLGGLLNSDMLGGLLGALMGGGAGGRGASPMRGGAGLGGLGSLLGMLTGAGGGMSGGAGGLLGALLGGALGNAAPPPPPSAPVADTPRTKAENILRAMVYAARADGRIDPNEQSALKQQVQSLGLGAEAQGIVDRAISEPLNPNNIARNITSSDEAVRLFALSCAITKIDDEREQSYIADLGNALGIPQQTQQALISRMLGR